jgi:FkbM family methyltransferase
VLQGLVSALGRLLDRRADAPDLVRLGSEYGGYAVPRSVVRQGAVCYSAGLGEDATFDLSLIEELSCEVWAIDPTPRAVAFGEELARREPRFHLVPVALWSEEGELRLYAPRDPDHVSHSALNVQATDSFFTARSTTVGALMRDLGHQRLDLLKLNVEGAEVPALESALRDGIVPPVLCVALEHPSRIRIAIAKLRLRRAGYQLVWREQAKHTYVA